MGSWPKCVAVLSVLASRLAEGGRPAGPSWAGARSRSPTPPRLACFHFRRVLPWSVGERPKTNFGRFSERRRHGASRDVLACPQGSRGPCRSVTGRARHRTARQGDTCIGGAHRSWKRPVRESSWPVCGPCRDKNCCGRSPDRATRIRAIQGICLSLRRWDSDQKITSQRGTRPRFLKACGPVGADSAR